MKRPRRRRASLADFAKPELTVEQRAAYAICVAIYLGHDCACEQRGAGSVCETIRFAALAARRVYVGHQSTDPMESCDGSGAS